MITDFEELPGWTFDIHEKSVGVYEIRATDKLGRSVNLSGTNYDELIDQCKRDAKNIENSTKSSSEEKSKSEESKG